jgi:hypothetical protein
LLLESSIRVILTKYGITKGSLELDETDRERSKNAKKLFKLGKQKDKKSGGYFNGQCIVFLLLVTDTVSLPVGFGFYQMNPNLKNWQKQEAKLKKAKLKKQKRPTKPVRNLAYPTKLQIGLNLVKSFHKTFGEIEIKAVKADALYGTAEFLDGVAHCYPKGQVISQIRNNQKIQIRDEECCVGLF